MSDIGILLAIEVIDRLFSALIDGISKLKG